MRKPLSILLFIIVIIVSSCENEPIGKMEINRDIMDSELYDLITQIVHEEEGISIECIIFNYPFALFVFDENQEFIEVVSIGDDLEFINFLEALDENYSISINFPISGTLSNGDLIEINTNEELRNAIDNCLNDALKRRCDNTLIDCVWRVTEITGASDDFEDTWFMVNYDGTVTFHDEDEAFFGTWVTLFIGNELYLNIDLNDGTDVEDFWDYNWNVHLLSNETISISHEGVQTLIEKDCSIPCNIGSYQACELENNPGIAMFNLNDFTPCIGVPPTHDIVSAVTYSFHETQEDAEDGINPISGTEYENNSNPQIIFVRTVYTESGIVIHFSQIIIEAIVCSGG